MASSHELLVIESKNGIVAIQEIGVEDDFDTVVTVVEQFDTTDLVENGVVSVISHVVSDDRG